MKALGRTLAGITLSPFVVAVIALFAVGAFILLTGMAAVEWFCWVVD